MTGGYGDGAITSLKGTHGRSFSNCTCGVRVGSPSATPHLPTLYPYANLPIICNLRILGPLGVSRYQFPGRLECVVSVELLAACFMGGRTNQAERFSLGRRGKMTKSGVVCLFALGVPMTRSGSQSVSQLVRDELGCLQDCLGDDDMRQAAARAMPMDVCGPVLQRGGSGEFSFCLFGAKRVVFG